MLLCCCFPCDDNTPTIVRVVPPPVFSPIYSGPVVSSSWFRPSWSQPVIVGNNRRFSASYGSVGREVQRRPFVQHHHHGGLPGNRVSVGSRRH